MTDRQLRWRLGLFAVIALVLLGTLIILFGSLPPLFKHTHAYIIRFEDAPGLRVGVPVRRSGVRIGEVTEVTLNDQNGMVYAHVDIESRYTVRKNEQPTLTLGFLGNDASIDFIPLPPPPNQEAERTPVPPGSEIDGTRQVSVSTLISRASEVVPTTQEVLTDLRKSLRRLEDMAPLMEQTLREYRDLGRSMNRDYPDLEKSLKTASDDVGATARQYRQLGENLNVLLLGNQDKLVKTLDALLKALESANYTFDRFGLLLTDRNIADVTATIKNVREASDQAPAIAKNTRDASDSFPSIAKNADELLKDARPTLKQLQQTLARADVALTDLQRATQGFGDRGPAVSKNLDESLDKFNRAMTDVRELMRVIGQSNGTLNRVVNDPALYNDLDAAACQIAKMMPRLDHILKNLETFADKLARHPELIGVSGAIKPSDGMTDSPVIGKPGPH
jgi:phospholipid/cholesterol/gamma-HCH transport system substrate-binding protein